MSSAFANPIERFMDDDLKRLHLLVNAWEAEGGRAELASYQRVRRSLIRRGMMEESVLLPYVTAKQQGRPLPIEGILRGERERVAAILANPTGPSLPRRIRMLLLQRQQLEDGGQGLHAMCDRLAGDEAAAVVERLRAVGYGIPTPGAVSAVPPDRIPFIG